MKISMLLPALVLACANLASCGGGGGGNSDRCVSFAENICYKFADCVNSSNQSTIDQCFAEELAYLNGHNYTQDTCNTMDNTLDDMSCGQLIALATRSYVIKSGEQVDLGSLAKEASANYGAE